jgi:tetratricopeptide (TPR) repeat protein
LSLLPDNASFCLKKAVRFAARNKYKIALGLCKIALIHQPNDYFANYWYANILYHLRCDKKACHYFKRAIELDPKHSFAHFGLGRLHFENVMAYLRANLLRGAPGHLMYCKDDVTEPLPGDEDFEEFSLLKSNAEERCCNRRTAMKELKKATTLIKDINEYQYALSMIGELYRLEFEWGEDETGANKIKVIIEEAGKTILNDLELQQVYERINSIESV